MRVTIETALAGVQRSTTAGGKVSSDNAYNKVGIYVITCKYYFSESICY